MQDRKRDLTVLQRIVHYCDRLEEHHGELNPVLEYEVFSKSRAYSDAVAFCVFQIAELCQHLSPEARAFAPDIPWHGIRGMRNIVAHNYGEIKPEILWNTAVERIPELCTACTEIIQNLSSQQ
ncbi:MAG: DUF86 domain-containing protein [Oscillospiraceae bacterium]|jgi:uncharacterized protein with HEPN domain|nr:DUF86 domain-containing protein [Oscillospiraceae bacterium]